MKEITTDHWHCFNCQQYDEGICRLSNKQTPATSLCSYFNCKTFDEKETKEYEPLTIEEYNKRKFKIDEIPKEMIDKVKNYLLKRERDSATEEIVKLIKRNEIIRTTRDDDNSEMWIYKGGIYIPQGKTYIQEYCRRILTIVYTTQLCNLVISKIEADTYTDQEEFFNAQNDYPELIPVKNGVLNIRTKEMKNFDSSIPFFTKLTMNYNSQAKCENIKRFIKEILPKDRDDLYETIKELFGYSLLKEYKYEKSFMFWGIGRNGKGKLLELFKRFVGIDNCRSISLTELEKDNFCVSALMNKLLNISGDISNEAINDTGTFKQLTGRDTISANRKFKTRVNFTNYAKMIFAGNDLPHPKDTSDGFWMRWILIEFPYQFLPQKEINLLKDKRNIKLQDPDIIDKISTELELEGLLVWALEGYNQLISKKDFSYKLGKNAVKSSWLRKSNSVMAFIEDCIDEDYDNHIVKKDFKQGYIQYCRKHNVKPLSDKVIKITIENETGAVSYQHYDDGNPSWVWDGIKYKQDKLSKQGVSYYTREIESPL